MVIFMFVRNKDNQKGRYLVRSVNPNSFLTLKFYRTAIEKIIIYEILPNKISTEPKIFQVSPRPSTHTNKKTPRILYPQGPRLKKEGGLLLSRIALQYHRRNRA